MIPRDLPWPEGLVRWVAAHAYTPNEVGHYGGGYHLMLMQPFVSGQLRRAAGDALCKPARKFWGLHEISTLCQIPDCKRCLELAHRHGIDIEQAPSVKAFRESERQQLRDRRVELLGLIAAIGDASEATRERVLVEGLARKAHTGGCMFGSASEIGFIDPFKFRHGGYVPCCKPVVAEERAPGRQMRPRCQEHVVQREGVMLGVMLASLPADTWVRASHMERSAAGWLAMLDELGGSHLVWDHIEDDRWFLVEADGRKVVEVLI